MRPVWLPSDREVRQPIIDEKVIEMNHTRTAKYYYGLIVFVTFLTLVIAAGIRSAPAVLIVPFEEFFGWNRAEISLALSINLLLNGLCGPFAAALMERYGVRPVIASALLLLGAGAGLTLWMQDMWQMILLWGIVIGIGSGFLSTVFGTVVATRWFIQQRGLILGIFSAAGAAGQLLFLPLFANILEWFDWHVIVWVLVAAAFFSLALIILIMRNGPGEVGLVPYGTSAGDTVPDKTTDNPFQAVWQGLKTAVQSKAFWLLSASFFVCGATSVGLIGTHFVSACVDHGITAIFAAGLLSAASVFNIIGVTAAGWLSDRYDNRWLLFWYYLVRGLALFLLPAVLVSDRVILIIFVTVYGLNWIATVPSTIKLAADLFGDRSIVIFGWMMALHQAGSALAAFYAGALQAALHSYTLVFISAAVLCLVAAMIVFLIPGQGHVSAETI
ncbi:Major Facilitator Superfamily protein [Desulfitobacterium chlororespirans DSM 11544]|uniref:Major Facilitator Superfamily protein n=2 Tax=Desulfitobacterium chlororespirans TaxID=51616 RepID=A0A1M7RYH1_9FIRM|nr:Major Facilitator Superfamily protein [Desulfitobacterium chlororespirans DSM 11544]